MAASRDLRPPWVLVSGGFHRRGAMDRANLALAEYLLSEGRDVHLVGHDIDPLLASRRGAQAYPVPRLHAVAAGELMLERAARRVRAGVQLRGPDVHIIVNGGNCAAPDANWVHSVHHAWPSGSAAGAPAQSWAREIERRWFRRRERRAFRVARVVIANSARTRQDLLDHFPLDPARIHVIPPGADPSWRPASFEEQREARAQLSVQAPTIAFLGALGADDNKGFGALLQAWRALCADPAWSGTLLAAGGGPLLEHWQRESRLSGLDGRVRFLGFVSDVTPVFAAADLVVSASRYEAYGLAIAEAVCRGIPAILPDSAGIAPALGGTWEDLLVRGPANADSLADALRRWASAPARWRDVAATVGQRLRQYTLDDMAGAIVRVVES